MELRHLRHFLVLSEELHFARAAQRLRISQPPLSSSIRKLEQELAVKLFERTSRHVALSRAGMALVPKAREMLASAEGIKNLVQAVDQGRIGRIEIGFNEVMIYRGFPEIVLDFSRDVPEVELVLVEKMSWEQLELITSGRLDGAFLSALSAPRGLSSLMLLEERFVACVPSSHSLARRKEIPLAALRDETFIMYSPTTSTFDHVIKLCRNAGFSPRTKFVDMRMLSVVGLVSKGFGVAVVPESFRQSRIANAAFINLAKSTSQPTAFFVWNADKESPGLTKFISTVRQHKTGRRTAPRKNSA